MSRIVAVCSLDSIPNPSKRRDAVAYALLSNPRDDLVLAENYDSEGDGFWVTIYGPESVLRQVRSRIGIERGASAQLGTDLGVSCLSVTGNLAQVRPLVEQALTAVPA